MKKMIVLCLLLLSGTAFGQWQHEIVDSMRNNCTTIAVNSSGHPAIAYCKGLIWGGLMYAEYNGSTWQKTKVDSSSMWILAPKPSLCFDKQGWPHIAYISSSPKWLRHAWRDGSGWHIANVDSPVVNDKFLSIAADTGNNIHIVLSDSGGNSQKYAYFNGTSWSISKLPKTPNGYEVSIVVDKQNHPHIATSGRIYYRNLGSGWLCDTLAYTSIMAMPMIRIDGQNRPNIVFYSTNIYRLLLDGAWQLDTANTMSCFTAFDLDANDKCHIVHSDYNLPCSLSYTTNRNGYWESELISANKKMFSNKLFEIAIGDDGTVHVCDCDTIGSEQFVNYYKRPGTGVTGNPATPPAAKTAMLRNSPNPFGSSTMLEYRLRENGMVNLKIYDLCGRLVKTLVSGRSNAGTYSAKWDGTDAGGKAVPSGVYICRLAAGGVAFSHAIIKLK
jgi:hypothetical protein